MYNTNYRRSSYYPDEGSSFGSRSSTPDESRSTIYLSRSSSLTHSLKSFRSLAPSFGEGLQLDKGDINFELELDFSFTPPAPPTPLKAAYTQESRRTEIPGDPRLRLSVPSSPAAIEPALTSESLSSPLVRTPSPYERNLSPEDRNPQRGYSPSTERFPQSPSSIGSRDLRSPSPFGDRYAHSPPPLNIDRPTPSPIFRGSPMGTPRSGSPLPQGFEIAVPPGSHAPGMQPKPPADQVLFPRQEQLQLDLPFEEPIYFSPRGSVLCAPALNTPTLRSPAPAFAAPPTQSPMRSPANAGPFRTPSPLLTPPPIRDFDGPNRGDAASPRSFYKEEAVMTEGGKRVQPSSGPDLNGLWNASQGAHPMPGDGQIFILNIFRLQTDPRAPHFAEDYAFGPKPDMPFYCLRAHPLPDSEINEISLSRRCPSTRDPGIGILNMQMTLSGQPTDDLVTQIYPRRAVIAAKRTMQRTSAAVAVAAQTECCKLRSTKGGKYWLEHPGISSARPDEATLVVQTEGSVGFGTPGAKGSIRLINMTNKETLAALDFRRGLLFVNTNATAKIRSQHTVDVAVSTVLAVGIAEGRKAQAATAGVEVRDVRAVAEAKERPRTGGSRDRKAKTSPVKILKTVGKGLGMFVLFFFKLPWEIIKAIVYACKPLPDDEHGKRR